jgi:hypothetical protein
MSPAEAIYLLCAATSLLAAVMLLRQYRRRRSTLLLWSVVAFTGLAVSNVLVYVDLVLLPTTVDLALIRAGVSAASMLALVYGLIWEANA